MDDKGPKDYWSECGQVFFHYGVGYGLTREIKSIPLGSKEDIKKYFETGELSSQLQTIQKEVLQEILDYRKEQGIGNIRATVMERAGNNGTSGHKPKTTRPLTSRKRLPLRPSRTKSKSLSRR
ncbi:hypothetical protein ACFLYS_03260 [Chloroflexota bacterium]